MIKKNPTNGFLEPIGLSNLSFILTKPLCKFGVSKPKAYLISKFFSTIEMPRQIIEIKIKLGTSINLLKTDTKNAPKIPPKLAPAEIIPNNLALLSLLKTSASKLQAVLTTKMLKTLTQI